MKKLIVVASALALLSTSCSVKYPRMVTGNESTKTGVAERTVWFGISIGHTDLSLQTAAKNGGITKIASVDSYYKSGLFRTIQKTIVTGN